MREQLLDFVEQSDRVSVSQVDLNRIKVLHELLPELGRNEKLLRKVLGPYCLLGDLLSDSRLPPEYSEPEVRTCLEEIVALIEKIADQFPAIVKNEKIMRSLSFICDDLREHSYIIERFDLEYIFGKKAIWSLERYIQTQPDHVEPFTIKTLCFHYCKLAFAKKTSLEEAIYLSKKAILEQEAFLKKFDKPKNSEEKQQRLEVYSQMTDTYCELTNFYARVNFLTDVNDAVEDIRKTLSLLSLSDGMNIKFDKVVKKCIKLLAKFTIRNERTFYEKLLDWLTDPTSANGFHILSIYDELKCSSTKYFKILCDFHVVLKMVVGDQRHKFIEVEKYLKQNDEVNLAFVKITKSSILPSLTTMASQVETTAVELAKQMQQLKQTNNLLSQKIFSLEQSNQKIQEKLEKLEPANFREKRPYTPKMQWSDPVEMDQDSHSDEENNSVKQVKYSVCKQKF